MRMTSVIIAGLWRYGDWRHLATGCTALVDDIITVVQQHRLRWYGHVLRKDETDWVKEMCGL